MSVIKPIEIASTLIIAAFLTACGNKAASDEAADVVFTNARVYTLDVTLPWAEAVAVKGNEIIYVGSSAGVDAHVEANTRRHDLGGQLLLPGFIDSHMHPIDGGAYAKALSLDTAGTVEEWVRAIADYAETNRDAPVLRSLQGLDGPHCLP